MARRKQQDPELITDPKELEERKEAAMAYGDENPDMYVEYCHECIKESEKATHDIRYLWDECYKAYRATIDYSNKQDWQAKVITGDMMAVVKQATGIVRKAFRQPDWFNVDPQGDDDAITAQFHRELLSFWLNQQHGKFGTKFSDACELGFAIGQSHEIIPRWEDGVGLTFDLVPPWQIHRDPDASPRDPWSGNYWIHTEWLDLWRVKALGDNGRYVRLDDVTASENQWPAGESQEKRARRKGQYHQRNTYRQSVKVIEQWGVVLDKQGNMLLPNARFMVAGDVLILNPEPSPYPTLRWPGVSFSPMPDMFAFEGHGLIESSLFLWLMSCNLMSLHIDDLNWRVNRIREINRFLMEDPTDVIIEPGKPIFRAENAPLQGEIIKDAYVQGRNTDEVLAILQYYDSKRENGSFINQFVAGLPGQRSNITKGEVEIKTEQSMGIFDSIGEDIEEAAIHVIKAVLETIIPNWSEYSYPPISRVFPDSPAFAMFAQMGPEERMEMLESNCDIKVSGVTAQIKNSDLVNRLQFMMQKAESQLFGKYFKPYELLKESNTVLGFYDPKFIVTPEEADQIEQVESQMQAEAMIAQEAANNVVNIPGQKKLPQGGPA
jgi:hypothetical protein